MLNWIDRRLVYAPNVFISILMYSFFLRPLLYADASL